MFDVDVTASSEFFTNLWTDFKNIKGPVGSLAGLLLVIILIWIAAFNTRKIYCFGQRMWHKVRKSTSRMFQRDPREMTRKRNKRVKRLVEDGITDVLEDMYYKKLITRRERNYWYRMFANQFELEGLRLQKPPFAGRLKELITQRIYVDNEHEPVLLPDASPVSEDKKVLNKKKLGAMFAHPVV